MDIPYTINCPTMKNILFLALSLISVFILQAQSKVFKEVGEDISTQVKAITQDNALVGYLAFTTLERADADSFNYRITIMDEDLNDIGTLNFKQEKLELQSVSFEQDVLCLGYTASRVSGVLKVKEARNAYKNGFVSHVLVQFISLAGKILNTYSSKIDLSTAQAVGSSGFSVRLVSYLKYGMEIKNISKIGFGVFYGDESKKDIMVFDTKGARIWDRKITVDATNYYLLASSPNIYLLTKNFDEVPEGGYTVYTYSAKDSTTQYKYDCKDKQGDWLKVLSFDNDPVTGRAFIAGCVINPDRAKDFTSAHDYAKNPYLGVFTLNLGNTNKDIQPNYSYWYNEQMAGISRDGYFNDKSFYVKYVTAFKDYKGNTVFAGTALIEKRLLGAAKYRLADGVFILQDQKGKLTLDNNITCDETKYFGPASPVTEMDKKNFYQVTNSTTKTNYAIIDDEYNTYVYNVSGQKLMRTIHHKVGSVKTEVYPAKEGHVMVSEYNKKEKQTRFSIEAL